MRHEFGIHHHKNQLALLPLLSPLGLPDQRVRPILHRHHFDVHQGMRRLGARRRPQDCAERCREASTHQVGQWGPQHHRMPLGALTAEPPSERSLSQAQRISVGRSDLKRRSYMWFKRFIFIFKRVSKKYCSYKLFSNSTLKDKIHSSFLYKPIHTILLLMYTILNVSRRYLKK